MTELSPLLSSPAHIPGVEVWLKWVIKTQLLAVCVCKPTVTVGPGAGSKSQWYSVLQPQHLYLNDFLQHWHSNSFTSFTSY